MDISALVKRRSEAFTQRDVVDSLREILWSREPRGNLQEHGVTLVPANFYSTVPSLREIETSFEYQSNVAPYLDAKIFDEERLRGMLESLIPYGEEFNPDIEGD
jgi:hypothetical protein